MPLGERMAYSSTAFRMRLALDAAQEQLLDAISAFDAKQDDQALADFRASKARLIALLEAMDETMQRTIAPQPWSRPASRYDLLALNRS